MLRDPLDASDGKKSVLGYLTASHLALGSRALSSLPPHQDVGILHPVSQRRGPADLMRPGLLCECSRGAVHAHCTMPHLMHACTLYDAGLNACMHIVRCRTSCMHAHCTMPRCMHACTLYDVALHACMHIVRCRTSCMHAHCTMPRFMHACILCNAALPACMHSVCKKCLDSCMHECFQSASNANPLIVCSRRLTHACMHAIVHIATWLPMRASA